MSFDKSSQTWEFPVSFQQMLWLCLRVCMCVYVGLTADARILVNRARIECQSHKLTVEDPVTLEYITRFIAQLKQVQWWLKAVFP